MSTMKVVKALNVTVELLVALLVSIYFLLEHLVTVFLPVSMKAKDVSGETVLVTGAGSGLGRLLSKNFARLGCKLVLWDVNAEGNEETAKQVRALGAKAYTYQVDVCDRQAIYAAAEKTKRDAGRVTIIINNAGIVTGRGFLESPDTLIQKTFDVNVLAHFWILKQFLPDMLADDHGHIVSISSLAGLVGVNKLVDYCASKFAVVGLDESLQMEVASRGLRNVYTTVVCPYYINTGMFDGVSSKVIPILQPEYVAEQIVNGVLTNEKMVLIPRYISLLLVLKWMLPQKANMALASAFGANEAMDHFIGRQKSN